MPRYTDESIQTISEMFDSYLVDQLKPLASHLFKRLKALNITPKSANMFSAASELPSRKAEIIAWLSACLLDETVAKALYEDLDTLSQAALQEAIYAANGALDGAVFQAKYGALPEMSVPDRYSRRSKKTEISDLAFLISLRGETPPDLQAVLRRFVPEPRLVTAQMLDGLPEEIAPEGQGGSAMSPLMRHHTEQAALQDLPALLQLIEMGKVSVSAKTGRVSKAGANAIRKTLSHGDFYPEDFETSSTYDVKIGDAGIRPFAWVMLLQAGKLAQINGSKLALTKSGKTALKKPAHETLGKLWKRWLKTTLLHELNRVEVIKGQKSKSRPLAAAAPCRQAVEDALAELEPGIWIETTHFFKFLIANEHSFSVVRNPWALYIGYKDYGNFGEYSRGWRHLEDRFSRTLLLEYAATLGLIDVALIEPWGALDDLGNLWGADGISCLSRYDGLWALRINPLGAWILGLSEKYVSEAHHEPSLRVLPTLEIAQLPSGAKASDALFLDRCCEPVAEGVWRLSLPFLMKAAEEGVDVKQVLAFLDERSEGTLPKDVKAFFKEAQKQSGKVVDCGEARLLECADAATAREIAGDMRLKNFCLPAGKRHLVIPSAQETQFRKLLREFGYIISSK